MLLTKNIVSIVLLSTMVFANTIPFNFYSEEEGVDKNSSNQGELKVVFKDKEGLASETLKGVYWDYEYNLTTNNRKNFIEEVKKNLESKEATFLYKGDDYLFFKFYNQKKLYWGKIVYSKEKYEIKLLEEKSLVMSSSLLKNIILKNLKFDSNKATLKKGAEGEIERIYQFLVENSTYIVEIQGHTDSSGKAESNLILSQKRANRVREELINKGIANNRIEAKGYGESLSIADNGSKEGRRKNRRVELKVLSE